MDRMTGTIQNGAVVLDPGPVLPDGTKVDVIPSAVGRNEESTPPTPDQVTKKKGSLSFLLKYAGKAVDLPADLAEQHDHYIHGTPKR